MKTLSQLKNEILADGIIDAIEVKELKAVLYADGIIDAEEADFLFELNDAVSGKENDVTWKELFVEAISSFLLEDDISKGEIDKDEAKWLLDKLQNDGKIDDIEMELLTHLKKNTSNFPQELADLMA